MLGGGGGLSCYHASTYPGLILDGKHTGYTCTYIHTVHSHSCYSAAFWTKLYFDNKKGWKYIGGNIYISTTH